jgi:hypothetical protein
MDSLKCSLIALKRSWIFFTPHKISRQMKLFLVIIIAGLVTQHMLSVNKLEQQQKEIFRLSVELEMAETTAQKANDKLYECWGIANHPGTHVKYSLDGKNWIEFKAIKPINGTP